MGRYPEIVKAWRRERSAAGSTAAAPAAEPAKVAPDPPGFSLAEQVLLVDAPETVREFARQIKTQWPDLEVVGACSPRERLAHLFRHLETHGRLEDAVALRENWEERAVIMEYDAGLPRARAEDAAAVEILNRN